MLKRSLVMPLPKDTNLLNQVCQDIDWEEAKRLPLCWLQQGAGLWNRITRGQAASERIFITCRGSDTKGRGLEMWLSCWRQDLPSCVQHMLHQLTTAGKYLLLISLQWLETTRDGDRLRDRLCFLIKEIRIELLFFFLRNKTNLLMILTGGSLITPCHLRTRWSCVKSKKKNINGQNG